MYVISTVIWAIVYVAIGCMLSAPYTFLADGNFENFWTAALVAPFAAFMVFVVCVVDRQMFRRKLKDGRLAFGGWLFWITTIYFCLPIILNGLSILLRLMGFDTISQCIFAFRYASLPLVLILFIVCVVVIGVVQDVRRQRFFEDQVDTRSKM